MTETIKINGYSVGDRSVGISEAEFSIDTGLINLDEDDKVMMTKTLVRDIYELHDNGDIYFSFSDDKIDNDFGYSRRFTYNDFKKLGEDERLAYKQQFIKEQKGLMEKLYLLEI